MSGAYEDVRVCDDLELDVFGYAVARVERVDEHARAHAEVARGVVVVQRLAIAVLHELKLRIIAK